MVCCRFLNLESLSLLPPTTDGLDTNAMFLDIFYTLESLYIPAMTTDLHTKLVLNDTPDLSEATLIPWCNFGLISGQNTMESVFLELVLHSIQVI